MLHDEEAAKRRGIMCNVWCIYAICAVIQPRSDGFKQESARNDGALDISIQNVSRAVKKAWRHWLRVGAGTPQNEPGVHCGGSARRLLCGMASESTIYTELVKECRQNRQSANMHETITY